MNQISFTAFKKHIGFPVMFNSLDKNQHCTGNCVMTLVKRPLAFEVSSCKSAACF